MQLIIYAKRTWELIKAREEVMTITTERFPLVNILTYVQYKQWKLPVMKSWKF
jgi:hypothetical protein